MIKITSFAIKILLYLINDGWLQINEDGTGHVLAGAGLGEEGVEGVIAAADGFVRGHLAVRLDAVLEAEELPAGVAHLAAALAHHDGEYLTHCV